MKNLEELRKEIKKEEIKKISAAEFKEKYNIRLDKSKFRKL